MSSLCDTCHSPGHCCKAFVLLGIDNSTYSDPEDEIKEWLEEHKLPFVPLKKDENNVWWFSCPKLGPDGRCTIYQDRPKLCKDYEPGYGGLCVYTSKIEKTS